MDGSPVPGILQARTLEWVAISSPMHESEKWKWRRSVMSDSSWPHVLQPTRLLHPWDFSRQEYWSGSPLPSVLYFLYIYSNYISLLVSFIWFGQLKNEVLFILTTLWCSVQLLSCVRLFATPWTAASQVSLSFTNSWSLFKLMSIEPVMLSNHLILCHPLLLPPSIFPSTRIFSKESVFRIKYTKY